MATTARSSAAAEGLGPSAVAGAPSTAPAKPSGLQGALAAATETRAKATAAFTSAKEVSDAAKVRRACRAPRCCQLRQGAEVWAPRVWMAQSALNIKRPPPLDIGAVSGRQAEVRRRAVRWVRGCCAGRCGRGACGNCRRAPCACGGVHLFRCACAVSHPAPPPPRRFCSDAYARLKEERDKLRSPPSDAAGVTEKMVRMGGSVAARAREGGEECAA